MAVAFWKMIRWILFEIGPKAAVCRRPVPLLAACGPMLILWNLQGTPEASKMLLEGGGGGDAAGNGLEKAQSNGADLGRTTSAASDNRSVVSVVVPPTAEPEDRISMLESSNQRIEAMLRALTSGDGGSHSPGTTAAGSLAASGHRKMSTDAHGTDQLYTVPTTGSSHY